LLHVGKRQEKKETAFQMATLKVWFFLYKEYLFYFHRRTKTKNCVLLIGDTNENYNTQKADTIQKSQLTKTGGGRGNQANQYILVLLVT